MATTPSPAQQSASAYFKQLLNSWGIGEIFGDAQKLITEGLDTSTITLRLQDTDSYKKRFAVNDVRQKAGLPVLSPAEIVDTEASLSQVLREFGLPAQFWTRAAVTDYIARDVSAAEVSRRAADAQALFLTGPAENRSAWRDYYGLSDGLAIAAILDPRKAQPLIHQQVLAAQIGGAAIGQGLTTSRGQAETLAAAGVTGEQATQGYAQVATAMPVDTGIAQRFGQQISQTEEEAAAFGTAGAAAATEKRRKLAAAESGLFAGRAAADTSSLSRPTVGQY
jgi:hypothetical protein